jgi:hypothetical protein
MEDHGAATIKEWMRDLIETARTGRPFETSAGADAGRSYAYLEFHKPNGQHSALLFQVDHQGDRPIVRAHHVEGSDDDVRERINALVPAEHRPDR